MREGAFTRFADSLPVFYPYPFAIARGVLIGYEIPSHKRKTPQGLILLGLMGLLVSHVISKTITQNRVVVLLAGIELSSPTLTGTRQIANAG